MPRAGFETKIPAKERLQTHALDGAATISSSEKQWSSNVIIPTYVTTRHHIPEDSTSTQMKSHQQYIQFDLKLLYRIFPMYRWET